MTVENDSKRLPLTESVETKDKNRNDVSSSACMPTALHAPPGYQPQSRDCSVEADLLDFWLLRQRSPQERLKMGTAMMRNARKMSLESQRQQYQALSREDFAQHIARCWLQEDYFEGYTPSGCEMTWIQDSGSLAAHLHQIFEELSIAYFITGGLAAIAWGEPRTTRDVDMVRLCSQRILSRLLPP